MAKHESPDPLTRGLRAVADDDEQLRASSAVGMRLMAEVQGIGHVRRRRRMAMSIAVAAPILAATLAVVWPRHVPPEGGSHTGPVGQAGSSPPTAPVVSRELVTEFFPLAYSNVPARGGYVVRMQVPREALAFFVGAAALESSNGGSGQMLADVVIGDDGLARAVRFVRVVSDRGPLEAGLHEQEQTP